MTIKDVAQHCGVSITTVSRVLNNHPDVKEAVRAKVLKAIEELHYVPNNSARDLGKSQTDTIGVVLRGASNPFLISVLHSIEKEVAAAGYTLTVQQIDTCDDELSAGASLVRSKRLRGLILLGGEFDYTPQRTAGLKVPFVCCTFTGSFGSLNKDSYSSVSIDDYAEAYRAVKTLLDHGHRRVAILLESTHDRSISELRYRGYCDALRDAGIQPDPDLIAESGSFEMLDVYKATKRLISRCRDFTALFTISDLMAMAAIKALHSAKLQVPTDCSVISIDGLEMTRYTVPTLTSLVQPAEEMGTQAVRILTEVLKGTGNHRHIRLSTALRDGETVANIHL